MPHTAIAVAAALVVVVVVVVVAAAVRPRTASIARAQAATRRARAVRHRTRATTSESAARAAAAVTPLGHDVSMCRLRNQHEGSGDHAAVASARDSGTRGNNKGNARLQAPTSAVGEDGDTHTATPPPPQSPSQSSWSSSWSTAGDKTASPDVESLTDARNDLDLDGDGGVAASDAPCSRCNGAVHRVSDDVLAHERAARRAGHPLYTDPASGMSVMTADALRQRGKCCGFACRHCPYAHVNVRAWRAASDDDDDDDGDGDRA